MSQVIVLSREQLEQLPELRRLATEGDKLKVRARTLGGEFCLSTSIGMVALKGGSVLAGMQGAQLVEHKGVPAKASANAAAKASQATEPRWSVEDLEGNDRQLTADEIRAGVKAGAIDGSCLVRRPGGDRDELLRDVAELQAPITHAATSRAAPAPSTPEVKPSAILAATRAELGDDEHARDCVVSPRQQPRRSAAPATAIRSSVARRAFEAADAAASDDAPAPGPRLGSAIVANAQRAAELAEHTTTDHDGPEAA